MVLGAHDQHLLMARSCETTWELSLIVLRCVALYSILSGGPFTHDMRVARTRGTDGSRQRTTHSLVPNSVVAVAIIDATVIAVGEL